MREWIQVFDSWAGALGADGYVRYVAPYSRALIDRIRSSRPRLSTSVLAPVDFSANCTPPAVMCSASTGA